MSLFRCPRCQTLLPHGLIAAGEQVACPHCAVTFVVLPAAAIPTQPQSNPGSPPALVVAPKITSEPSRDYPFPNLPTSSRKTAGRRPAAASKINLAGHIVAPIIGILLGYAVLCWLKPGVLPRPDWASQWLASLSRPRTPEPAWETLPERPASAPLPPVRLNRPEPIAHPELDDSKLGLLNELPEQSPPPPIPTPKPKTVRRAVSDRALPIPQPRGDIFPIAGNISSIDLPPLSTRSASKIIDLVTPINEHFELSVVGGQLPGKSQATFEIETSSSPAPRWLVRLHEAGTNSGSDREIAEFTVRDAAILFCWKASPEDRDASQLRNALLQIGQGKTKKLVKLRTPSQYPDLEIDLVKRSPKFPLTIEALPNIDQLRWEIVALIGVSEADRTIVKRATPVDATHEIGFPSGHAEMQLRLSLDEDQPTIISTAFYEFRGRKQPLAAKPLKRQFLALEDALKSAQAELPRRLSYATELPSALQQAQSQQVVRDYKSESLQEMQIATAVTKIRSEIRNNANRIVRLRKTIPGLEADFQYLQSVVTLAETIHQRGKIRYRIFYLVKHEGQSTEIDLIRSSGSE